MKQSNTKKYLHATIFGCCVVFTIYQSLNCISKYLNVPKGTSVGLTDSDKVGNDFPATTFCTMDDEGAMIHTAFNKERLQACNLNRGYEAYAEDFEWVSTDLTGKVFGDNENCTNPKKLFEQIVAKPSDLIYGIKYYYMEERNGSSSTKVYPELHSEIIKPLDHAKYGRCYSVVPTQSMVERRINRVVLYLKISSSGRYVPNIIFHTPGTLTKGLVEQPKMYYTNTYSHQTIYTFEYEVHRRLRLGSDTPCEEDVNYNYDLCKHQLAENRSIAQFGCTTPYGPNKDKICTNSTVARKVMQIYTTTWEEPDARCEESCKSYNIRPTKMAEGTNGSGKRRGYTKMTLNLKGKVITSTEVFLYSGLSLIAEIGGYVGLFLGVSVNQISTLVDIMFEQFQRRKVRKL